MLDKLQNNCLLGYLDHFFKKYKLTLKHSHKITLLFTGPLWLLFCMFLITFWYIFAGVTYSINKLHELFVK
jgi:hypothetical protein